MTIWYISTSGSDSTGNGSLETPYATVSKCITVGTDGDTIKILNGTYNVANPIVVNKQFTITSNSGINTDVIINAAYTAFKIQNSNITISYLTMQGNYYQSQVLAIDPLISMQNPFPTFFSNNTITNCIINYSGKAFILYGNFNITNNTFNLIDEPAYDFLLFIPSMRGSCNISNNNFIDNGYFTTSIILLGSNTAFGDYYDWANSKGGILNIYNNNVNFTHNIYLDILYVIIVDYFNQYIYGPHGPDEVYNDDTRLSLNVYNNTIITSKNNSTITILCMGNSDFNTFSNSTIYNNTNNRTNYGALHLGKNIYFHSFLTIDQTDLDREVFRIYNNKLSSNGILPT